MIYLAHIYNIKLIIPLLNEWQQFGGVETYLSWAGVPVDKEEDHTGYYDYDNYLKKFIREQFWTNDGVWELYCQYVLHMLYRENTYTGVAYKDDPAIMIWEIMNEPRWGNFFDIPTLDGPQRKVVSAKAKVDDAETEEELAKAEEALATAEEALATAEATLATIEEARETVWQWLSDAADFIHDKDPNHLIGTGEEGFLSDADHDSGRGTYPWTKASNEGINFAANAEIRNINVLGFHCWPFQWGLWEPPANSGGEIEYPELAAFPPEWIEAHVKIAQRVNKPLYLGEFGLQILRQEGSQVSDRDAIFESVFETAQQSNIAGVAYWHMTASHDKESVIYKGQVSERPLLQATFKDVDVPHDNDFRFDIICGGDAGDSTCDMIADFSSFMTAKVTQPDPDYVRPCREPQTQCGQECVLLPSHPMHCGACDKVCPLEQTCKEGQCKPVTSAGASSSNDGVSGDEVACNSARIGSRSRPSFFSRLLLLCN